LTAVVFLLFSHQDFAEIQVAKFTKSDQTERRMRIFLLLLCLLTETVQFRLASSFDIAGFRVRCTNNLRSGINPQLLNPNRPTSAFQSCNKGQVVEHRTTLRPLFLSVDNIDSPKKGKAYKDAIKQTTATVLAAASFAAFLGYFEGYNAFVEFSAGYLVEQSLSVDNLFVFLLLFEYFKVPFAFQNKILNWGIIGAMVMRAVMIAAGAVALKDFHGILLVFAGILVFSSGKILTEFLEGEGEEEEENLEVRFGGLCEMENLVGPTELPKSPPSHSLNPHPPPPSPRTPLPE
jgi:hypothetical protein